MITLNHISAGYSGQQVIKDFSLHLPQQGVVCLFAPSGSGKTTLLRILSGLHREYDGEVLGLEGKKVSIVFQENRLLSGLTALYNVALVLPKGQQEQAKTLLEKVGLGQSANKLPRQLSGGMNRRLAIARALAYGGQVFLLDEPFQGLDQAAAEQVMDVIRAYTQGSLVVLVTHSREAALRFADQVVICGSKPMTVQRQFSIPEPYGKRDISQLMERYGNF